jgi:hypothetical protein
MSGTNARITQPEIEATPMLECGLSKTASPRHCGGGFFSCGAALTVVQRRAAVFQFGARRRTVIVDTGRKGSRAQV